MSLEFLEAELEGLEERAQRRVLRVARGGGRTLRLDGRELINFSSNDYLGLSRHPALVAAAGMAVAQGTGATASRLVVGNRPEHEELEQRAAAYLGTEAATLFGSGYLANLGVISALAGRGDMIVSDQLNHASLIDGCRLSRAEVVVIDHGDVRAAEAALAGSSARRRFLVTDALFSMDGDAAPVGALARLAQEYRAVLIVDEAHALGVLGPGGRGICAREGVLPDVLIGTFGKAVGGYGAFAAGSALLHWFLLNRARSFVFSTGLPPAVAAAATCGLELLSSAEGEALRRTLRLRCQHLASGLQSLGLLASGAGRSPIFPLVVGSERSALALYERMLERGLLCLPIRPPTVPPGTSRLRIVLSACHTDHDVAQLLETIADAQRSGLVPRGTVSS